MKFTQEDGTYKLVAQTMHGLEEVLAKEVEAQGGTEIEILKRAVRFTADQATLIKTNLWCRTAVRISTEITQFTIESVEDLYNQLYDMNWERIISDQETFMVTPIVTSHFFNHTQFAAFKAKDAIVDKVREYHGVRPNVDKLKPDFRIVLKIFNNDVSILIDSSGDALFKRGYRQQSHVAPINECLAAGLILLSDWDQESGLLDPFCGSGTIPIEAAMIALNIPPNDIRERFGFMAWPGYDEELFNQIKSEVKSQRKDNPVKIYAMDISLKAMDFTEINIESAKIPDGVIIMKQLNFFDVNKPMEDVKYLILNPPYDERIDLMDAADFYSKIGDQFKTYFQGCSAWMISANLSALKRVGLRPSRKIALQNGPLDAKFMNYQMYSGSKKAKKQVNPESQESTEKETPSET